MAEETPKPEVLPLELRISISVVLQHSAIVGAETPVYVLSNVAAGMHVGEKLQLLRMVAEHIDIMLRQVATPKLSNLDL